MPHSMRSRPGAFWHQTIVWFVAMLAGGYVARHRFAVAAVMLVSLVTFATLALTNRLLDAFSMNNVQTTLPGTGAHSAPTMLEFGVGLAVLIVVAVAGALCGEWLFRRRAAGRRSATMHRGGDAAPTH